MSWPNKVYSRSKKVNYVDVNDSTLVRNINGPIKDGKILDSLGVSSLTSIPGSSNVNTLFGPLAKCYPGVSAGYNVGGAYPIVNNQSFTACVMVSGVPLSGAGAIVHSAQAAGGGTCAWYIAYSAPPGTGWLVQCNLGATATHIYGSYSPNKPTFVSIKVDHTIPIFGMSLDGVSYSIGRTLGSYAGFGNAGLILGGRTNTDVISYNGLLGNLSIYSELKTDAWIRLQWLKLAQAAQFQTGWGAKVSIANESTAGNFVGNGSTPFEILSGTWNLNTSTQFGELTKTIECIAAGTLWLDNSFLRVNSIEGAYGSWQLRLTHNAGTASYVGLACSSKSAFASHNGYAMKLDAANVKTLIRHAAAVETLVVALPAGEVSHIARRFDNVWSGFARADATPTSWVVGATATDVTYTSSQGMCFTLNAGDRLSLSTVRGQNSLIKYLGEFSPAEV